MSSDATKPHITYPRQEDDGKTQRPSGSYWVLTGSTNPWMVAYWSLSDGFWLYPGRERLHFDSYFKAIDERRIVREETTTERTAKKE